jgi:hypothetical protein
VNGLRRDVLNLCHQAEPTFVRAVESNRVLCYDSMPDPVELAIGWVRTSSRLAAMRHPTPVEMAERMLLAAVTQRQIERLAEPRFTGYATGPAATAVRACEDAAEGRLASADDNPARRLAAGETMPFSALGLPPRLAAAGESQGADLPVLSLGGAGDSGASANPRGMAAALFEAAPTADLGSDSTSLLAPRTAAAGCRTPA